MTLVRSSPYHKHKNQPFLKYPNLCHIKLLGLSEEHYFTFKPGMVKSFAVDYSPQGHVIVGGGKPSIVNISMSFEEASIWTSSDYPGEGVPDVSPKPTRAWRPVTGGGGSVS